MHRAPELLIFDCDGVLVDSETISLSVLVERIAAAGGKVSEDEAYRHFLGRSMASVHQMLRQDFGFAFTEPGIVELRAEMQRRFRAELKPVPGIAEALSRLPQRRCVASSSQIERIRMSLGLAGLLEMLDPHLYSASMVERGKPAPDLFLHAAREMGADPRDCLVIEDSPAGIDAARAAGMRVFAFTGGSHAGHASLVAGRAQREPDLVFDDMRRLPELIDRMWPPVALGAGAA
jgi:HAD superfamily hydrolase (TIGR01509 family)